MRSTITGILAVLAIALQPCSALAEVSPVPIVAADRAVLAIPGAETRGHRLTAVHFWAIWCIPCLSELPQVDSMAAAYADKDVRFVAISLDMDLAKVTRFFTDKNIRMLTAAIDKNNAAYRAAGLKGLPGTLFFNIDGELIARADGPVDWKAKATKNFIELPR